MTVLIVRRTLGPDEFPAWEERFRARAEVRKAAGCQGVQYFRSLDNPDEVVMIFEWRTRAEGQAFLDAMIAQFPQVDDKSAGAGSGLDYLFAESLPRLAS